MVQKPPENNRKYNLQLDLRVKFLEEGNSKLHMYCCKKKKEGGHGYL